MSEINISFNVSGVFPKIYSLTVSKISYIFGDLSKRKLYFCQYSKKIGLCEGLF